MGAEAARHRHADLIVDAGAAFAGGRRGDGFEHGGNPQRGGEMAARGVGVEQFAGLLVGEDHHALRIHHQGRIGHGMDEIGRLRHVLVDEPSGAEEWTKQLHWRRIAAPYDRSIAGSLEP